MLSSVKDNKTAAGECRDVSNVGEGFPSNDLPMSAGFNKISKRASYRHVGQYFFVQVLVTY